MRSIVLILSLVLCLWSSPVMAQLTNADPCPDNASVWIEVDNSYLCSGTLVAMDWVLTSAHCVEGMTTGYVGLDEWKPEPYWMTNIEVVKLHPLWAGGGDDPADYRYDLALVQASEAAPRAYSSTAPLSAGVGTAVTLDGYGSTGIFRPNYGVHRCGQTTVDVLQEGMVGFSTAPGEVSACLGDSGGGVYEGDNLVAVLSGAEAPLAALACRTGTVWAAPVDEGWIEAVLGYKPQSP